MHHCVSFQGSLGSMFLKREVHMLLKMDRERFPDAHGTTHFDLTNTILNAALQKGDIIKVLKKYDNGKWFGQKGDRTGYFQFNYVQVIPASESPD